MLLCLCFFGFAPLAGVFDDGYEDHESCPEAGDDEGDEAELGCSEEAWCGEPDDGFEEADEDEGRCLLYY